MREGLHSLQQRLQYPLPEGKMNHNLCKKRNWEQTPTMGKQKQNPSSFGNVLIALQSVEHSLLGAVVKKTTNQFQSVIWCQCSGISLFQREIAPVVSSFRYTSFIAHSFSSKWKHRRATSNLESTKFSSKDDYAGALTAAPKFLASWELLSLLIAMETGISRGNWSGSSKQRAEDVSKWRGFSRKLSILSL